MKKKFGLLLGLFLISVLFVVSVFTGNAIADQCESCQDMAVEKLEAVSGQKIVQPIVMASVFLSNHADSFETLLVSNFPEITEKQGAIELGRTAYLIKPYIPNGAEMTWIQVMKLKVRKSQNTHCPCPWKNDPLMQRAFQF